MNRKAESRIGEKYGRLTVHAVSHRDEHSVAQMLCRCECGKVVTLPIRHLRDGKTKSCGCLYRETRKKKEITND